MYINLGKIEVIDYTDTNGVLRINVDGKPVGAEVEVSSTSGYQNWKDIFLEGMN